MKSEGLFNSTFQKRCQCHLGKLPSGLCLLGSDADFKTELEASGFLISLPGSWPSVPDVAPYPSPFLNHLQLLSFLQTQIFTEPLWILRCHLWARSRSILQTSAACVVTRLGPLKQCINSHRTRLEVLWTEAGTSWSLSAQMIIRKLVPSKYSLGIKVT